MKTDGVSGGRIRQDLILVSARITNAAFATARRVAMKMGRRLALLLGHVSIEICSARRALPAAHFDRNESHVSYETGHRVYF